MPKKTCQEIRSFRYSLEVALAIYFFLPGSKVLIAVVLGILWSTNLPPVEPRYHFMDLFCGEAQATKTWPFGRIL